MTNATATATRPKVPWYERPICAFDLETTGPIPGWARLVTASVIMIDDGQVSARNWLADPGGIPEEATEIHGITAEYAKEHGRDHDTVVREVADALRGAWAAGYTVVAFNAAFDLTVITKLLRGEPFTVDGLVIDPMVIDGKYSRRRGSRKLVDQCDFYKVKQVDAHQAEGDALAAARLAWKMPRRYPIITRADDAEMMRLQAIWYRERKLSFIEHRKEIGKPIDDINTEWPVAS